MTKTISAKLPNLPYLGHGLRRLSHNGVEMFCLRDILASCEYISNQNHMLYYNRVSAIMTARLIHPSYHSPMVFATEAGVMQMIISMMKPEARAFQDWFSSRPSALTDQSSILAQPDKDDLRATLTSLKADIHSQEQVLHQIRVQAATIEAKLNMLV